MRYIALSILLTAAVSAYLLSDSYAFSFGISERTRKSSTPGCSCHPRSGATSVSIECKSKEFLAGKTYEMSLVVKNSKMTAAGLNVAARHGTLSTIPGSDSLYVVKNELTHKYPRPLRDGVAVFRFYYTAPKGVSDDIVYANGNAVNMSQSPIGDAWNFSQDFEIEIKGSPVIP